MSFPWKFALLYLTELSAMMLMQRSIIFSQNSCVTSRFQSTNNHSLLDNSAHRSDTSRRVYDVTSGLGFGRHYEAVACTCSSKYAVCDEYVTSQAGGKDCTRAWPNADETRCWTATTATTNLFQFSDAAASAFFQYSVLFFTRNLAIFISDYFYLSL